MGWESHFLHRNDVLFASRTSGRKTTWLRRYNEVVCRVGCWLNINSMINKYTYTPNTHIHQILLWIVIYVKLLTLYFIIIWIIVNLKLQIGNTQFLSDEKSINCHDKSHIITCRILLEISTVNPDSFINGVFHLDLEVHAKTSDRLTRWDDILKICFIYGINMIFTRQWSLLNSL